MGKTKRGQRVENQGTHPVETAHSALPVLLNWVWTCGVNPWIQCSQRSRVQLHLFVLHRLHSSFLYVCLLPALCAPVPCDSTLISSRSLAHVAVWAESSRSFSRLLYLFTANLGNLETKPEDAFGHIFLSNYTASMYFEFFFSNRLQCTELGFCLTDQLKVVHECEMKSQCYIYLIFYFIFLLGMKFGKV